MSFGEILLTLFVALLVFGPKHLPMVAHHLGKCWAFLSQYKERAAVFWQGALNEYQLQENTKKAKEADFLYQKDNKTMIEAVSTSSIKTESLSDRVPTINAIDLSHLLQTDAPLQLIDVREVHERAICHIGGELIPLGELESSLHRFAKDKTTVVYCRSGGRSDYACRLLIDAGFLEVKNLSGGILAWIDAVDPSLIRY